MVDSNDKPIVYQDGSQTVYRASSLLSCPAAFIHARLNHESRVPANLRTAFSQGHAAEPIVIDMLRARGYPVSDQQYPCEIALSSSIIIRGHLDGIINSAVLEIKALSHDNTEKFRDDYIRHFPAYAYQISSYMYGTGLSNGVFAIYDKSTTELHLVFLTSPPISLDEIKLRVSTYESAWKNYLSTDFYPPCTTTTFCPYYHLHEEYRDDPVAITVPGLADTVAAYQALSSRIKILEDARSALRSKIEADIAPGAKVSIGGFHVSMTSYSITRLDVSKTKQLLGDRYESACTVTTATRLTVKKEEQ